MISEIMTLLFGERYIFYILYAVAFGSSVIAFMQKSMKTLRALIVLSSSSYVLYYFFYPEDPLWMDIVTETIAVIINFTMLLLLIRQEKEVNFTDEEKDLYSVFFAGFSPFEFYKLSKMAQWSTLSEGTHLSEQGSSQDYLYFIYDGQVDIIQNDKNIAKLYSGYFIGEISFSLGAPANATVVCGTPTRVICWDQRALRRFLEANAVLKSKFETMITTDLVNKLHTD